MNTPFLSAQAAIVALAQKVMEGKSEAFSKEKAQSILDGKFSVQEKTYFVRKAVAALNGEQDILNDATLRAKGITNFNGGKIEGNRLFVANQMSVAAVADEEITAAAYSPVVTVPGIVNGETTLRDSNGKTLISVPTSSLILGAAATSVDGKFINLQAAIPFTSENQYTLTQFFAAAMPVNQNIEISFRGAEVVLRS